MTSLIKAVSNLFNSPRPVALQNKKAVTNLHSTFSKHLPQKQQAVNKKTINAFVRKNSEDLKNYTKLSFQIGDKKNNVTLVVDRVTNKVIFHEKGDRTKHLIAATHLKRALIEKKIIPRGFSQRISKRSPTIDYGYFIQFGTRNKTAPTAQARPQTLCNYYVLDECEKEVADYPEAYVSPIPLEYNATQGRLKQLAHGLEILVKRTNRSKIFYPVHVPGHFASLYIDRETDTIMYYDPYNHGNNACPRFVRQYVHYLKKEGIISRKAKFKKNTHYPQKDGWSCGHRVILFFKETLKGRSMRYIERHPPSKEKIQRIVNDYAIRKPEYNNYF